MQTKPLLSIVIPTKNRQRYCLSAIQSILNLNDPDIQIVIQDNSTDEQLRAQIPQLDSSILKYSYIPGVLSFVENFNNAIDAADGEYLCIIGDDDGINPEIIQATAWAKHHQIECLVGNVEANYRWDNTGAPDTFFTKMTDNTLTMTHFNGKAKRVNIEESLIKLMKNGCTNYLDYDFPKLYHGIVKKTALQKLKDRTGSYLKGLSPDIYASIALACTIEQLVVVDYPLTIPGVCAESGSIQEGQLKKHSKELASAPHFRGRTTEYEWDEFVPKLYCVQTIWADSAFAALKELGRKDYLLEYFDEYMLYANILEADNTLTSIILKHLKNKYPSISEKEHIKRINMKRLRGPFRKFMSRRVLGRIKKIFRLERFEVITDLNGMEEATQALQHYLTKLNLNLIKQLEEI